MIKSLPHCGGCQSSRKDSPKRHKAPWLGKSKPEPFNHRYHNPGQNHYPGCSYLKGSAHLPSKQPEGDRELWAPGFWLSEPKISLFSLHCFPL